MKGFDPIRASAKITSMAKQLYSKSFHKSHIDELVKGKVSANSGDEAGNLSPIEAVIRAKCIEVPRKTVTSNSNPQGLCLLLPCT